MKQGKEARRPLREPQHLSTREEESDVAASWWQRQEVTRSEMGLGGEVGYAAEGPNTGEIKRGGSCMGSCLPAEQTQVLLHGTAQGGEFS